LLALVDGKALGMEFCVGVCLEIRDLVEHRFCMKPVVIINYLDTNPLEKERVRFYLPVIGFVSEDESRLVSCLVAEAWAWTAPWTEGTTRAALMTFYQSYLRLLKFV
jgi:hypothetical protein